MTEARRGHLAMLAFSALVAGSFSLGSMAAPHIAPEALNAVRFILASVLMLALVMATGGMTRAASTPSGRKITAVSGRPGRARAPASRARMVAWTVSPAR